MNAYVVQPGDTPMLITQKLIGNPTRMSELVRSNAHKPTVMVGKVVTFRSLVAGEKLTVPPRWRKSGLSGGLSGKAYPQPSPHFRVRPRAGGDGGGDDSGHGVEPILTISGKPGQYRGVPSEGLETGLGRGPCCNGCTSGGPCECECAVQMPPCSAPQAPPSIPGSTSFPVGFGRGVGQGPITTQSVPVAVVASWGMPLAVGAVAAAAGFGLAYLIRNKT